MAIGRQLLESAADIQRRADVVFVGFVFMTLLDLGLLVLFGVQHPNCKQRSPRVYISGVDQGAQPAGQREGERQRPHLSAGKTLAWGALPPADNLAKKQT